MKRSILYTISLFAIVFSTKAFSFGPTLSYGKPESVGMDGEYLNRTIDSIIDHSIENRCFPGCQILVARRGKIVFQKSYGYHTYEQKQKVENNHLYDMASCTKVMAATLCLMRLVEEGKISLDEPFSKWFEEFRGTDKEECTLREFLAHQSGIRNLSFSKIFFDDNRKMRSDVFCKSQSEDFPYQFSDSLYVCKDIHAKVFQMIVEKPLGAKKEHYACTSFHCYPTLIERLTGRNYEEFLYEEFYRPLEAKDATYNPLRKYPRNQIVPTERDRRYRNGVIHGFVHDEAAASLGGVSGNAGLFASAESLAPILQMLLNGGVYNGRRYLNQETIRQWTTCQYPESMNHRAIGFDRRRFKDRIIFTNRKYYYAPSVSEISFGHSGFTGTMVWVDPATDLIFIFLSNRVHPSRSNPNFSKLNPRAQCHEAVYESIRRRGGL
jgi:CubicO group peptidase (beta-lactamase class C family)